MKITEHLKQAKRTLFSIEILPPKKGQNISHLYNTIDELRKFDISFIDVTYHREEYIKKLNNNGDLVKSAIRKRPGTVAICAALQARYQIDAVPHIICGGFSREDTENALIDLNFLDIDNVLVLRGDPPKGINTFEPNPDGHAYAIELLEQVSNLNKGIYLDSTMENANSSNFCIGVAGYPEKHFNSPSLEHDVLLVLEKQRKGADFAVTQLFFDNNKYFEFVKKCREAGVTIPIIPGIKPLATKEQLIVLPEIFHVDIPEVFAKEVRKAKDNKAAKEVGIEWCIQQCKELIDFGAPVLHFYTMSKAEITKRVAEKVF